MVFGILQEGNGGVELGVVVGRSGRRIRVEEADEYIYGYTVHNDVTMRDSARPFPHVKMTETLQKEPERYPRLQALSCSCEQERDAMFIVWEAEIPT